MKVLIVEDDQEIVETVSLAFQMRWPEAKLVSTHLGEKGIELVESENPDVVMLDLGLVDISGFEVLKRIRLFSSVPVLIVTVRAEEADIVRGLEAGADDYIVKPFSYMELLARVKAVLRRSEMPESYTDEDNFVSGDLEINFATREVRRGGEVLKLTPTEHKLLYLLVRNKGRVVTHRRLMQQVWGEDYIEDTNYLRTYIRRLRDKLQDDPPQIILTEHGLGYRFVGPS